MSVASFLVKNKILWPLIAVVGAGVSANTLVRLLTMQVQAADLCSCCPWRMHASNLQVGGSLGFAGYYLSNNQDVVINKKIRDPWNNGALPFLYSIHHTRELS
jgi:hypothetical protein